MNIMQYVRLASIIRNKLYTKQKLKEEQLMSDRPI